MARIVAGSGSEIPASPEGEPGLRKGPGILFLVATPIGNLEDVTLRALRVFREVDWIAAEDTRRTRILLQHYGIECTLISHHAHTEHRRGPQLVERLRAGERGALVTDAGTPGISDPGFLLARMAREAGVVVEAIPGPSAVLAALLGSGLPCERFTFLGYPPPKGAVRQRFMRETMDERRTTVLFESPHRILRCLEEIAAIDGSRELAVCRELTKRYEEVLRGNASDVLAEIRTNPRRGEFTLVISPAARGKNA